MAAIWIRNTLLNQIVLIATLAAILSIPHLFIAAGSSFPLLRFLYVGAWRQFLIAHGVFEHLCSCLGITGSRNLNAPNGYFIPTSLILILGTFSSLRVTALLQSAMADAPKMPIDKFNSRWLSWFRSWHLVTLLLFAIGIVASPALYRSVFTNDLQSMPPSKSTSKNTMSDRISQMTQSQLCETPDCRRNQTGFASHIPGDPAHCPYCLAPEDSADGLERWLKIYSYPKWWGFDAPGFQVELAFLFFLAVFVIASAIASVDFRKASTARKTGAWFCAILSGLTALIIGFGSLHAIRLCLFALFYFTPPILLESVGFVALPPLLVSVAFLAMVISAGIMGNLTRAALREDLARMRALAIGDSAIWVGTFGFALLGPPFVDKLLKLPYVTQVLSASWIGTTISSVLAGKSSKSSSTEKPVKAGGATADSSKTSRLLISIGPAVFVLGLLLTIATSIQLLIKESCISSDFGNLFLVFAGLSVIALLLGNRLDINDFSMHAFYRDRIARCFAGASHPHRRPDRFTGFASSDSELRVIDLLPTNFSHWKWTTGLVDTPSADYPGPLPIFCTTVNLTFGQDLAWQERKGASFVFTPMYSGYSVGFTSEYHLSQRSSYTYNGFTSTDTYACPSGGIHMHSAVAISGAAVSPNWGYHSNPAMAFLLTMFNVRLGWWIKNPRLTQHNKWYLPSTPRFPLFNLVSEMIGRTTDTSPYIYLTDGGHFENMGLYELARRRCRFIVVCDGEQDGDNTFEGIGMAIRKVRVDFGVEIDLNLTDLDFRSADQSHTSAGKLSPCHFVIGNIRYPEDDDDTESGTVVYIKASLTGDEPGDVLNYKREHDAFPHEPTADQWFSESQFESYRRLGYHIILDSPVPPPQNNAACRYPISPAGPTTPTNGDNRPKVRQSLREILHLQFDSKVKTSESVPDNS